MALRTLKQAACVAAVAAVAGAAAQDGARPYRDRLYANHCAVCHGERLEGAAQGTPLVGAALQQGDTVDAIAKSIAQGSPEKGMPKWEDTLSARQIRHLALYIAEVRSDVGYSTFHYSTRLVVPQGAIASKHHDFALETVIDGLDPLPYSIAPLPDGGLLLTEKKRGLSVVSAQGVKSAFVEGTPKAYADSFVVALRQEWGHGWLLDVAIHPEYEKNGWVYLHFGDRCEDCAKGGLFQRRRGPLSMNKVVRGRIQDGRWTDEQVTEQLRQTRPRPTAACEHSVQRGEPGVYAGGRVPSRASGCEIPRPPQGVADAALIDIRQKLLFHTANMTVSMHSIKGRERARMGRAGVCYARSVCRWGKRWHFARSSKPPASQRLPLSQAPRRRMARDRTGIGCTPTTAPSATASGWRARRKARRSSARHCNKATPSTR